MKTTTLSCQCGAVQLEAAGAPILSAECCCNSCREAAGRLATLPGAPRTVTEHGSVHYVLQRKDRLRIVSGAETMREFRLKPDSRTRRVVATCCSTPLFLEFQGGHWVSVYAGLWPEHARPQVEMRTMAGDLPDPAVLPADVPNQKGQGGGFMLKLLAAWIAMGFRVPRIDVPGEPLRI